MSTDHQIDDVPVCIVCADYAQVPGQPHLWQQCPRLAIDRDNPDSEWVK